MLEVLWTPHPYRAGFCITDDTDAATLDGVKIVYDFLASIGLRTSKTVWAFTPAEPCGIPALPPSILRGITLEDPGYLAYCVTLRERGFEICLHGASAGNNVRDRTARALDLLEARFGLPGTYVCHAKNAENPYWHEKVAPRGLAQRLLAFSSRYHCSGEDPKSPYFWGDLCLQKVRHIRLFRTRNVNTLAENPSMPYFDPEKPWVTSWFSATKRSFADATTPESLAQLTRERGLCVLYQYMHRYADLAAGRVQEAFRASAERLMATSGIWVDTTSALMDRLRQIQGVLLVRRGDDVWVGNAGATDIRDLQILAPAAAWTPEAAPGMERGADGVRLHRLAAGTLVRLPLGASTGLEPRRSFDLDRELHARVERRNGAFLVNAANRPWEAAGQALASGTCRFVPLQGMEAPRPMWTGPLGERYRLLAGQLAIIGREVAFKGRSLDSRRFLGAEEIALEDHANW
jgi:hypothetical protein